MYLFLPIRKTIKVLFTRYISTKSERTPLTLHNCLESAPKQRRWLWKYWFILFLAVPICFYIFYNKSSPILKKQAIDMSENDLQYNTEKLLHKTKFFDTTTKTAVKKFTLRLNHSEAVTKTTERNPDNLPICEIISNGTSAVTLKEPADERLNNEFQLVKMGGYHRPQHCHSRHKVGILVPFRDREQNLAVFLFNIHPFLMRQNLEYRIFIIEQIGKEEFNKGCLFNAGFKEMKKFGNWKCVIFHDVDLLPLDERIMYTCPIYPRHMCASVVEKQSIPGYRTLFGGVTSMTMDQYKKVNGYSNIYWGWGGEDNDMFWRLKATGQPIVRYKKNIARYTALPHAARSANPLRYNFLNNAMDRFKFDGLSNVNYTVVSIKLRHLYTHIKVDINPKGNNLTNMTQ